MAKYNFELKKKIVLEHLSLGVGSKALAKKYNVKSARQIRQWIHNYNEFGEEGLKRSRQKNNYSFEFKLHMVESYLSNEVSYEGKRSIASTLKKLRTAVIGGSWLLLFSNPFWKFFRPW